MGAEVLKRAAIDRFSVAIALLLMQQPSPVDPRGGVVRFALDGTLIRVNRGHRVRRLEFERPVEPIDRIRSLPAAVGSAAGGGPLLLVDDVQHAILEAHFKTKHILTIVDLPVLGSVTHHDAIADRTDAEAREGGRFRQMPPQIFE